jgi:copper(I)-binding protein
MRQMLLASLFLLATPIAAVAQEATITIDQPWSRATAGRAQTGVAYLSLTDHGVPDTLTGFSTPVADSAELHESSNDDGVMKMRPVASLPLPAGQTVTLAPSGYHVMLIGLKQPLHQGDSFPLTVRFAHAAPQTVTVTVAGAGAPGPGMGRAATGGSGTGGSGTGGVSKDGMEMGGHMHQ